MDMITEGAHIARDEARRDAGLPDAGEYLTYRVGAEEYGIAIETVQEIRCYETPTRVPGAPPFVRGVVNLRGVIVPVIDLRLKLGTPADCTPLTVVIVLAVRERVVGAVVDSVSEVLALAADAIRPPPELAEAGECDFITGIAGVRERMLMLVDMEQLLGPVLGGLRDAA
jgi:purine-binding chemotaxis protein CheW